MPQFVDAIDWGWAFFLTKPFFYALLWLKNIVGGFGLAILAFTVLIKIPLLPLYNASYKSMAKMKKLQEPMKEITERFKGDPQRKQQEIMKLYKQEGANPVGGCLPILLTIPIFYALYKTLFVTLEMRHEPFMFLKDLSAPDPTAIGNLFGLIPWMSGMDIKAIPIIGIIIGIGILPIPVRCDDGRDAEPEPAASRPDTGQSHQVLAADFHVRIWRFCLWPRAVLGVEQHSVFHSAIHHYASQWRLRLRLARPFQNCWAGP